MATKVLLKATAALGGVGFAIYGAKEIYQQRNPQSQLNYDPTKKTIAVLGSGWAATSFLKGLDTENFNVVVVSPRNYFLFSPLLPSTTVGTVELRSIMQPIRYITRQKKRKVMFVEGDCSEIDTGAKTIKVAHQVKGDSLGSSTSISYDYLIIGVGAENATFGIPGVREHANFLKEAWDAQNLRSKLMDRIETAGFPSTSEEEKRKLLHLVVVGGGPTGVEFAAEMDDFLKEDLKLWYPEVAENVKITLVEATNNILPMFSKSMIEYTEKHLTDSEVELLKNTTVKGVDSSSITVSRNGKLEKIDYGILVWATGLTPRPLVLSLIKQLNQASKRGLLVDKHLQVQGCNDTFALGDVTSTQWAPTAQVAASQGYFLSSFFNELGSDESHSVDKVKQMNPDGFQYHHLGTLAYVGRNSAIADHLPGGAKSSGWATNFFWKSAYLSKLFSFRNRVLVAFDWTKKTVFGRDISRE
jgi:NADH:ubiquinone reductase (non-electrogenic)